MRRSYKTEQPSPPSCPPSCSSSSKRQRNNPPPTAVEHWNKAVQQLQTTEDFKCLLRKNVGTSVTCDV
jgi:hypothetical protein